MIELKPGINCIEYAHVGSRVTCNPPVLDTDDDVIVLVSPEQFQALETEIYEAHGDRCGESYGDDSALLPMRLGEMNYLLTEDVDYYHDFLSLSAVVKDLNILDKETRKAIFKAVMDGDTSYLPNGKIDRVVAPTPALVAF